MKSMKRRTQESQSCLLINNSPNQVIIGNPGVAGKSRFSCALESRVEYMPTVYLDWERKSLTKKKEKKRDGKIEGGVDRFSFRDSFAPGVETYCVHS